MVSRADRSRLSEWWWTVDQALIIVVIILTFLGIIFALAASPAIAERHDLPTYHFVWRQVIYGGAAIVIMFTLTFLSEKWVRRAALLLFGGSLVLMGLTLMIGMEIKGSQRWLHLPGFSIQPSEFAKPAFVVIAAWLFAEGIRRPDIPGSVFSAILLIILAALLVAQPDYGQTALISSVWVALLFLSGLPVILIAVFAVVLVAGLFFAYLFEPHVAGRINRFLDPTSGDTFQVDTAMDSMTRGGWFGRGPGEGTVKRILPDSHTDFIFAVAGEEFGIIMCLALVGLFAFVVLRSLIRILREPDHFKRLAVAGLAILIGLQAFINVGVNLQLLPAKGMTLPFISYGGSSLLSLGIAVGFLIALSRRNPKRAQTNGVTFSPVDRSAFG